MHIFEYEWENKTTREKLMKLINNISDSHRVVYARNTVVRHIDTEEARNFLNKYHLQNYTSASIQLGCFSKEDNKLIGVMTFGTPRFNNEYDYEIIRLCWLNDIKVVGGSEKLFTYFVREYNPQSVLTYCDISKFRGNSYTRLGFKPIQPNPITKPNYVWVSHHGNEVKSRYQTQKQKLIDLGLGEYGNTEDDIMKALGYYKIYDAGNIRLEWKPE